MNVEPETTTLDAVVVDVASENGTSKTRRRKRPELAASTPPTSRHGSSRPRSPHG
jgi:hypothetical protein